MASGDDQFPTPETSAPPDSFSLNVSVFCASFHSAVPDSLNPAPVSSDLPSVRISSTFPFWVNVVVPVRGPFVTGLSRPVQVNCQVPARYSGPCFCWGCGGTGRPRPGPLTTVPPGGGVCTAPRWGSWGAAPAGGFCWACE